jgi:(E)-4-hydroxy-3-methylbut-2-enyl-diphosphate synthase
VVDTVKILEEKLSHIKEPITLSVIGCVVNGPGEAIFSEIGLTGGGKDDHMMYLSGLPHHKVASEKIIEEVISLVENKSKELKGN